MTIKVFWSPRVSCCCSMSYVADACEYGIVRWPDQWFFSCWGRLGCRLGRSGAQVLELEEFTLTYRLWASAEESTSTWRSSYRFKARCSRLISVRLFPSALPSALCSAYICRRPSYMPPIIFSIACSLYCFFNAKFELAVGRA